MKTKVLLIIVSTGIMIISSCKKDQSLLEQNSVNLADDDAVTEAVFEDVFNSVDNATISLDNSMKSGDTKSTLLSSQDSCPAVTVEHPSSGIWPKVINIDFGTGCTGFYDNTRSGKIIIEVTGPRREQGSVRTVSFDNYYFNGVKVEGVKVFKNLGLNANQNYVISVKLTGGKLTLPDDKTVEREFTHEREWISGFSTNNIWDDECLVTGTASGKNADGIAYANTIINPLYWKRVCAFIVSGTVQIARQGYEPFELDYGDGGCDNKATVSRGGESKEIALHHRFRFWNN